MAAQHELSAALLNGDLRPAAEIREHPYTVSAQRLHTVHSETSEITLTGLGLLQVVVDGDERLDARAGVGVKLQFLVVQRLYSPLDGFRSSS